MIVYDLPGLHNLSVDCGLDSIQWIVSLDFGLWILDCELTNVDGRLHCDLDFGELITLACSPKPLVRLNCLVVRYQPQQSIFDSGDFGLCAALAHPSATRNNAFTRFLQFTNPLICCKLCFICQQGISGW